MGLDGREFRAGRARNVIESGLHIGHWCAERLGTAYTPERSVAIGLVKDGTIQAGVIFDNWNLRSIMAHIVVEGRLTKHFIASIFHYPYQVARVEKIICPVEETNLKSRRLAENMGFVEEARLTDCHPNGSLLLYTLRKSDCRFLGDKYAGEITALPSTGT